MVHQYGHVFSRGNMFSTINDWLIQWFQKNSLASEKEIQEKRNENFFSLGWIDSFKFIILISDIEDHFNVEFNNDDFQNRNFSTLSGLSEIINMRMKK